MNWLEALALAVIQGLTEFLPVSSSGTSCSRKRSSGSSLRPPSSTTSCCTSAPRCPRSSSIAGTWLACSGAAAPYRQAPPEIGRRGDCCCCWSRHPADRRHRLHLQGFLRGLFASPSAVLVASSRRRLPDRLRAAPGRRPAAPRSPWWKASLLGVAQAIAIVPGISRSGSTIVAGLALGLRREMRCASPSCFRCPPSAGRPCSNCAISRRGGRCPLALAAAGFAAAAVTGYLAILFVLRWTREADSGSSACTAGSAGIAAAILAGR